MRSRTNGGHNEARTHVTGQRHLPQRLEEGDNGFADRGGAGERDEADVEHGLHATGNTTEVPVPGVAINIVRLRVDGWDCQCRRRGGGQHQAAVGMLKAGGQAVGGRGGAQEE